MSKRTKEAKKREKARQREFNGICPRCKHKAHQHELYQPIFANFLWGRTEHFEGALKGVCLGTTEKADPDGMVRIIRCECDLTPPEAQLNSERASSSSSKFEQIMGGRK